VEVDGSEIWNTAYNIDGGSNKDSYPLMKPWANYTRVDCGDVDCSKGVNMGDYGNLNDYVSGIGTVDSIWASDVDCNRAVNMGDYGKLNDYVSAVIPSLNCCKGCEV